MMNPVVQATSLKTGNHPSSIRVLLNVLAIPLNGYLGIRASLLLLLVLSRMPPFYAIEDETLCLKIALLIRPLFLKPAQDVQHGSSGSSCITPNIGATAVCYRRKGLDRLQIGQDGGFSSGAGNRA